MIEERKPRHVQREHYFAGYDNPNRFASYWHQVEEVVALGGRVLEVGIGNGTVTAVLRARGFEVTTADVNESLRPDVVADIRSLPFSDKQFDSVLASEVLEHLPWVDVPTALSELERVASRGVVVSVPNADVAFTLQARIPNAVQLARLMLCRRIPVRTAVWGLLQRESWRHSGGLVSNFGDVERLHPEAVKCDEHEWELGATRVRREDFVACATRAGLRLVREYRAPRFPIHHFFVFASGHSDGRRD